MANPNFGDGNFGDEQFGGLLIAAGWSVDLYSRTDVWIASDVALQAFRIVWSLDGPGSFEAEISESDAAAWLPGQRRVLVQKDGVPKWAGFLTGLSESSSSYSDLAKPKGATLRASGLGLAGILARRVIHGDINRFLTVATSIAWGLIQEAQGQTYGNHGFVFGSVTGTAPARTRHYCDGDNIADAINELAALSPGGFDWEISELGAFRAWVGGRGTASGETLTRAEAQTWDVNYDTTEVATFATVLGDTEEPCGAPLVIRNVATPSTYGRLESVIDMDSNDASEMNEAGDEELRSRMAGRVRVRAMWPEQKAPWAWGAVWLGDTVSVTLPAHFGGVQTMRVIEIAFSQEPPEFGFCEYELEQVG